MFDVPVVRERPRPPWHPVPVSELLMLSGLVTAGVSRIPGVSERPFVVLAVGLGLVLLGTLELTLREHLGGYRSHRLLLTGITTITVHVLFVLLAPFRFVGLPALAVDVIVFVAAFRGFRALWPRPTPNG